MTFAIIWFILWAGAAYWALRRPPQHKIMGSLFLLFALFGGIAGWGMSTPHTTVKTQTVLVGQHRLAKAKAESHRLALIASQQAASSTRLESEADAQSAASSAKNASESASRASTRKASQLAASHSRAAATAAKHAASTSTHAATATSGTKHTQGDLTTGQDGKIIGNKNSKIYHVPGQAGYHMNSSNAVYFQTEAQAKAAGYRKALR